MAGYLPTAWDVVVSALLPVISAGLIFLVEAKGPLSKSIRATRGVVAPYFASIAVLFGLFAALLASDVWQKTNDAKRAVQAEAHAVETLGYFARASGLEELIFPRLKAYAAAASAEDPYSSAIGPARNETDKAALDLLTTISQAYGVDSASRARVSSALAAVTASSACCTRRSANVRAASFSRTRSSPSRTSVKM